MLNGAHKSGWMTSEIFIKFCEHLASVTRWNTDNKILLIVDNETHCESSVFTHITIINQNNQGVQVRVLYATAVSDQTPTYGKNTTPCYSTSQWLQGLVRTGPNL